MEENENRAVIKYFHLKGLNPSEIIDELKSVLGENAPSNSSVFNWIDEFKRSLAAALENEDLKSTKKTNQTIYSSKSLDPYTCPICNQRFKNAKARNPHMRTHKLQFGYREDTNKHVWPSSSDLSTQNLSNNMLEMSTDSASPNPLAMSYQPKQYKGVRRKIVPHRESPNKSEISSPSVSVNKSKRFCEEERPNNEFTDSFEPLTSEWSPELSNMTTYESEDLSVKPEPTDDVNFPKPMENNIYTQNDTDEMTEIDCMPYVKTEPLYMNIKANKDINYDEKCGLKTTFSEDNPSQSLPEITTCESEILSIKQETTDSNLISEIPTSSVYSESDDRCKGIDSDLITDCKPVENHVKSESVNTDAALDSKNGINEVLDGDLPLPNEKCMERESYDAAKVI